MNIQNLLENGISEGAFPGASWAVGTPHSVEMGAAGRLTYQDSSPPTTVSTIFDLASLTKVVCTTSLAMSFWQRGAIDLDSPVCFYWPEFGKNGKESVTIRNLLCHNSGLIAFRKYHESNLVLPDVLSLIAEEALQYPVGTDGIYSDLGFIALGHVLTLISGQSLKALFDNEVKLPLGMTSAGFLPCVEWKHSIAPTEFVTDWRFKVHNSMGLAKDQRVFYSEEGTAYIQGEVHDETCLLLGGVSGHAGLFASVEDLAKFCQFLLGRVPKETRNRATTGQLPSLGTVLAFARRQSMISSRGLGWDTRSLDGFSSAGKLFGRHSFGHTGFTGTSLWIDPESQKFCILLTNRVHPDRERFGIMQVRSDFADLAFQII